VDSGKKACLPAPSDALNAGTLPVDPSTVGSGEDIRFRASKLWTNPPRDVWWELAPAPDPITASAEDYIQVPAISDLLPRIPGVTADAIERLRTYAVPFFERVIQ
jgi:hypothetical protein